MEIKLEQNSFSKNKQRNSSNTIRNEKGFAYSYKPLKEAIDALNPSENVDVDINNNRIVFSPNKNVSNKGLVFYPGAMIDFRAYAPLAKKIAERGHKVILAKMPYDLGVFGINKAPRLIKEFPEIKDWALGGHSDGGAMASMCIKKNPDIFKGVFFLDSRPESDLYEMPIKALALLAKPRYYHDHIQKYPKELKVKIIPGANHAYFGSYGKQKGDIEAKLTPEEQQKTALAYLNVFMHKL